MGLGTSALSLCERLALIGNGMQRYKISEY
jgi:hypothetical protein